MKKIIAAFDSLKFSESTQEYAIHIAKLTNAHIVGVFLDDVTYTSYKIYELITSEGASEKKLREYDAKDKSTRDKAVSNFENACRIAGLNYSIHRDRNVALQDLLHESIYADLLVIDRKETLSHYEEAVPTRFVKDLLADVQCPVLLAPSDFNRTEKLVFLYDGEPSSVHAVRMYGYLFPVPEHTEAEVVSVLGNDNTLHMPDNRLMKEFMKRHYKGVVYKILKGIPEEEIVHYLREQSQNTMIVLGAYRRGRVSRWFRQSMADVLMKELKSPLFIAHSK
jgi:hypothetical protein